MLSCGELWVDSSLLFTVDTRGISSSTDMPWQPKDATRHTKKASTPKKERQWSDVADSVLQRTGDEGRAVREANAVVKRAGKRKAITSESHAYNWRSRDNLRRS